MASSRTPRPERRRATGLTTVLLAVALTGCAGGFQHRPGPSQLIQDSGNDRVVIDDVPLPLGEGKAATKATEIDREIEAMAADDLWQRIRAGLTLPGHEERPRVRRWVQFFAARTRHLRQVAENAKPFLWHVVTALEARDMPLELALLPMVESGYDPTAYSYARASGMWQFMPYTGRRFGLEANWWYDGRRDPLRSTEAALDYLAWLHERYDDWALALAAYNAGEGRVDQALARAGERDYWALDLPRETENYVPKLLALRRILETPEQFAFEWPKLPNQPHTQVVTLPGQIELAVAAEMMDISESRLQALNPAVRRWATAPDGPHRLLVPSERVPALRTALAERNPDSLVTWRRHRVRSGEVLGTIAERYGTRVAVLKDVNDIDGHLIRAGQHLLVPIGGDAPAPPPARARDEATGRYRVANGDNLWVIARRLGVTVAQLRRWNDIAPGATLHPGDVLAVRATTGAREYRVRRGDSLWTIARRFDTRVANLRAWNGLASDSVLRPGQTLVVRGNAGESNYYRVQHGDSLWTIASRFSVAVEDLKSWNDIGDNVIQPGQRLRVARR